MISEAFGLAKGAGSFEKDIWALTNVTKSGVL